jgi:hypothetical protein
MNRLVLFILAMGIFCFVPTSFASEKQYIAEGYVLISNGTIYLKHGVDPDCSIAAAWEIESDMTVQLNGKHITDIKKLQGELISVTVTVELLMVHYPSDHVQKTEKLKNFDAKNISVRQYEPPQMWPSACPRK